MAVDHLLRAIKDHPIASSTIAFAALSSLYTVTKLATLRGARAQDQQEAIVRAAGLAFAYDDDGPRRRIVLRSEFGSLNDVESEQSRADPYLSRLLN